MGTVVVAIGIAGLIIGKVFEAAGTGTGPVVFFFFVKNGMLTPPVHKQQQQQMPKTSKNHAHHGQPPPSVVEVVVAPGVTLTGLTPGGLGACPAAESRRLVA